jgi:hypothetical protein
MKHRIPGDTEVVIDRHYVWPLRRKRDDRPQHWTTVLSRAALWLASVAVAIGAGWIHGILCPYPSQEFSALALIALGTALMMGTIAIVTARAEVALKCFAWFGSAVLYLGLVLRFVTAAGSHAFDLPEIH